VLKRTSCFVLSVYTIFKRNIIITTLYSCVKIVIESSSYCLLFFSPFSLIARVNEDSLSILPFQHICSSAEQICYRKKKEREKTYRHTHAHIRMDSQRERETETEKETTYKFILHENLFLFLEVT